MEEGWDIQDSFEWFDEDYGLFENTNNVMLQNNLSIMLALFERIDSEYWVVEG